MPFLRRGSASTGPHTPSTATAAPTLPSVTTALALQQTRELRRHLETERRRHGREAPPSITPRQALRAVNHWASWALIVVVVASQFTCIVWNTLTSDQYLRYGRAPTDGASAIDGLNDAPYSDRSLVCVLQGRLYRPLQLSAVLAASSRWSHVVDDSGASVGGYRVVSRETAALRDEVATRYERVCDTLAATLDAVRATCVALGYDVARDDSGGLRVVDGVFSNTTRLVASALPVLILPYWDNAIYARYAMPGRDGSACVFRLSGQFDARDAPGATMEGVDRAVRESKTAAWLGISSAASRWRNGWLEDAATGMRWYADIISSQQQSDATYGLLRRHFHVLPNGASVEIDCARDAAPCRPTAIPEWWARTSRAATSSSGTTRSRSRTARASGSSSTRPCSSARSLASTTSRPSSPTRRSRAAARALARGVGGAAARVWRRRDARRRLPRVRAQLRVAAAAAAAAAQAGARGVLQRGAQVRGRAAALRRGLVRHLPGHRRALPRLLQPAQPRGQAAAAPRERRALRAVGRARLRAPRRAAPDRQHGLLGFDGRVPSVVTAHEYEALTLLELVTTRAALRLNGNVASLFALKLGVLALNLLPLAVGSSPLQPRPWHADSPAATSIERAIGVRASESAGLGRAQAPLYAPDGVLAPAELVRLGFVVLGDTLVLPLADWLVVVALAGTRTPRRVANVRVLTFRVVLLPAVDDPRQQQQEQPRRLAVDAAAPRLLHLNDPLLLDTNVTAVSAMAFA